MLLSLPAGGARTDRRAARGGYRRLVTIIGRSHGGPRQQARAAAARRGLLPGAAPRRASSRWSPPRRCAARVVEVSAELQRDFSLHQTLSLYLLETLAKLDRDAPGLRARRADAGRGDRREPGRGAAQAARRLKTEKMAELKAAGVEYEQRIERARDAGVAQAEPRLHLRDVQRLRRSPPLGRHREHAAQVDRARDVRGVRDASTTTCAAWASSGARACCCAICRRSGGPWARRCRRRRAPTG